MKVDLWGSKVYRRVFVMNSCSIFKSKGSIKAILISLNLDNFLVCFFFFFFFCFFFLTWTNTSKCMGKQDLSFQTHYRSLSYLNCITLPVEKCKMMDEWKIV